LLWNLGERSGQLSGLLLLLFLGHKAHKSRSNFIKISSQHARNFPAQKY